MLSKIGVLIVFALAYNLLLGQGGMLSFGHAVYFGLAGYFVAHYLNGMGEASLPYFPVSLLPLVGGAVGLVFGILIGFRFDPPRRNHIRHDLAWASPKWPLP